MGDFNNEKWEREYVAHSILRGIIVLSESTGPIQSRLYNASVEFTTLNTSLQEFNTTWAYNMERLERYADKDRGIVNCSYEEAKNIISDIFTCLYYILDYNSSSNMVSQLEVSK